MAIVMQGTKFELWLSSFFFLFSVVCLTIVNIQVFWGVTLSLDQELPAAVREQSY
jgi:hypothetical protein